MKEKVLVDKEYLEGLEKDKGWKRLYLRTSATIREALLYGVIIPNNLDTSTVKKIENINKILNVIKEISEEDFIDDPEYSSYIDDPKFFPSEEVKKNIPSPLKLIINNKVIH